MSRKIIELLLAICILHFAICTPSLFLRRRFLHPIIFQRQDQNQNQNYCDTIAIIFTQGTCEAPFPREKQIRERGLCFWGRISMVLNILSLAKFSDFDCTFSLQNYRFMQTGGWHVPLENSCI